MTERRTVYQNAWGVRRMLVTDDDMRPGQMGIFTEQNLDEVLEGVARDRELHRDRATNKLVARVPITIYERSIREGWDEDDWKRWLNSSEAAPFRIWQGTV